jgi:hypothetical protein
MKGDLAERVLANVMNWDAEVLDDLGARLQLLATHKYDSYEGYRPGVKFLEHLAGWLHQFTPEERVVAVNFVLEQLVFVSRAELAHLIETVYPDHIRPMFIAQTAVRLGASPFAVKRIVNSDEFRQIQRRTLILGLSDGAHIDQLRRASPPLSHEQIFLATDIGDEAVRGAVESLRAATGDPDARFEQVVLVDDFYGSGRTLLREKKDGTFAGRLWRTHIRLEQLAKGLDDPRSESGRMRVLGENFTVSTLVYMASSQAIDHVTETLPKADLPWRFHVVQPLPKSIRVTDPEIEALCKWHYDADVFDDKHKKGAWLGYSNCALPLVLQHNTPNNAVCLLWADSTDEPDSLHRRALFPRYERHHEVRK